MSEATTIGTTTFRLTMPFKVFNNIALLTFYKNIKLMEEYTLAEQFLILALNPHNNRWAMCADKRNYGLLGAILQDLEHHQDIALEGKKVNVLSTYNKSSRAYQHVLDVMNKTNRKRRLKSWFVRLNNHARRLRYKAFDELAQKKVLRVENRQFLFFKYKKVFVINTQPRKQLIQELKQALEAPLQQTPRLKQLLLLVQLTKAYKLLEGRHYTKRQIKKKLTPCFAHNVAYQEFKRAISEIVATAAAAASA